MSKASNLAGFVPSIGPTNNLNVGVVTATTIYSNGQQLLRGVGIATGGGYVGSGATVIDFRGSGISTVTVSSGIATVNIVGSSAAGGGGSGEFNTGITSVSQLRPLSYETTVFSFPSTAGKRYIIESINVSNVYGREINIIAALNFNSNGNKVHLAYNVPLLEGSSVELLRQPHIANPSDYITMWTNDSVYYGASNAAEVYMTYTVSDDTNYFGVGFSTTGIGTTAAIGIFTSTTYPSVIQSIHLSNRTDNGDFPISVEVTNGVSTSYLVKNFIIPRYATVEVCDRPKRIEVNGVVKVSLASTNSIDVSISGKKITG